MVGKTLMRRLRVSNVRAELGLTQQQLAEKAGVARKTVSSAETRQTIKRLNAFAILNALNRERESVGKPSLSIDDLDWRVQGDGE